MQHIETPIQDAIEIIQSITCPNKHTCPDGTTCCKNNNEGYNCCPAPGAVCCKNRINCCPHATTCCIPLGCCPIPNAVCCMNSGGCCPQGTHCTDEGMCIPNINNIDPPIEKESSFFMS